MSGFIGHSAVTKPLYTAFSGHSLMTCFWEQELLRTVYMAQNLVRTLFEILKSSDRRYYQAHEAGWCNPRQHLPLLLGKTSEGQVLAIGGAWDAADGAHPEEQPGVLQRTAARHFKQATGLEIASCPKW